MSSYDRNNAINTNYENELNKLNKTAIHQQFKQTNQVPTPEPRRKLPQAANSISSGIYNDKLKNELAIDNNHQAAKLVRVRYHHIHLESDEEDDNENSIPITREPQISREKQETIVTPKSTTFTNSAPKINEVAVGRPTITNVDFNHDNDNDEEEEELDDNYYDEVDEEDEYAMNSSTSPGELVNLSKQSMVPLHELIAYYQYIQRGDNGHNEREPVSRQSSSSSQLTFKTTRHLQQKDIDEANEETSKHQESGDDLDSANYSAEGPISRVHHEVVVLQSENELKDKSLPKVQVQIIPDTNNRADIPINTTQSAPQAAKVVVDKQRIRANVILELINSERDFVKHLRDVVEGYLYPARRHPEIFTGERINTIFANIEQLYEFQRRFLASLESCINWSDLAQSEVGRCFLDYEKGFSVYHHYCNNHPNATSELQDLYTKPTFVKFFEACRVLQNMIDISLDGFLLTPIQKICKYPLQLTELLKNTDMGHPDYVHVLNALESMRNCANLANERKRRIEALADIMSFQEKIDNWFGPKLSETSSILIHSGEISKMTKEAGPQHQHQHQSANWSHNVQLYLFDHLLLYSKRDLLKRNSLILKGRINMDWVTEISDADEYKPKRSFKIYLNYHSDSVTGKGAVTNECFVFVTRTEREKDEWIRAFERERNLIESDENEGFQITEREIGVARRALQNRKHSRSARYRHKRPDTAIVDQPLDLDDANMIMNRTLSLPSCIHPSHVMNFVEDSRVVSTGRKKQATSPSTSSRSPMSGSQHLNCLAVGPTTATPAAVATSTTTTANNNNNNISLLTQDNHHDLVSQSSSSSSGGNWFKKMGSRKLSKGQVYTINQAASHANHSFQSSPPPGSVIATGASIVTEDSAALKYDQLEKRHRDHMVGEQQARLFRLNNDLPPPGPLLTSGAFARCPSAKSPAIASGRKAGPTNEVPDLKFQSLSLNRRTSARETTTTTTTSPGDGRPISESSTPTSGDGARAGESGGAGATFEATVLLSSGRVVRVREDAV